MYSVIFGPIVALVLFDVALGQEWVHSEELGLGYTLQWNSDYKSIVMKISAPTKGWVGVGFGIDHTMAGADLIISGIRDNEPYVWDCYARRNGPPTIDLQQNVEILNGKENATHTTVTVKRPLVASNTFDQTIVAGKMIVLWAFGQLDKERSWKSHDYHQQNRGSVDLMLLESETESSTRTGSQISTSTMAPEPQPTPTRRPTTTIEVTETSSPSTPTTESEMKTAPQPYVTKPRNPEKGKLLEQGIISFPYTAVLDVASSVTVFWDFDETTITLQMIAPTTGWIGLGFSRTASMNGADIIMMGVKGNEIYAWDCHSERNGVPNIDEKQDVEIIAGWENGTHTGVTVRRPRLPCNDEDTDIRLFTYKVIWAFGEEDLKSDGLSFKNYHRTNRGGRSLKLINPVEFRTVEELNAEMHAKVGPTDFLVPSETTHYLCKYMKIADANETLYVTGYEPYFTKGNEKNIHHATLYLCDSDVKEEDLAKNYTCYEQAHPFSLGCNRILGGWAVGSTGIRYPENSGIPVGGFSHPQYVMIEMHYDNPDKREFLDSSGLRLSFVREKPKMMASMFDVSQTLSTMWIPPGAKRYRVDGYCREKCLTKGMEESGLSEVKVFGVFFHSHLAGRAMRLRHFRDGEELPALARDEFYDFNYQEVQYFEEPKTLKPGDALTLECDYGTLDRSVVTPGGLPTTSEMCIALVLHYPPLDMSICGSRAKLLEDVPNAFKLAKGLNISINPMELVAAGNEMKVNYWEAMGIFAKKILPKVKWDDAKRKFAQEFTDNLTLYTSCINKREYLLDFYEEFQHTRLNDYVDKAPVCLPSDNPASPQPSGQFLESAAGMSALVLLILGAARVLNKKT